MFTTKNSYAAFRAKFGEAERCEERWEATKRNTGVGKIRFPVALRHSFELINIC